MHRRTLLTSAAALATACPARAQSPSPWPQRPVTIIVPYLAGGPSDALGRAVAAALQPAIGQPVVVENRPGANGAVAAGLVARAAPDGHTLFVAASSILTINPHMQRSLAYDPLRDFTPLTIAITAPNVIVANLGFPPHTVPELVGWLRANPGRASYGTSGIGSSEHLGMEFFAQRTGTELIHIPYGGGAAAVTDILAGTLQLGSLNIASVSAQVEAGALRALAVAGAERHPRLPGVPTVAESAGEIPALAGFEAGSWHSLVAPRGLPEPLAGQISTALVAALRTPETEARLTRIGFSIVASSRDAFAARLLKEWGEWQGVVRTAGLTAP